MHLPLLVFDGECGFCTLSVLWLLRRFRRPVGTVPWQEAELAALGLTEPEVRRWAWWIDAEGRRFRGHRAVGKALVACGAGWPLLGRLLLLPPVALVAAPGYRLVARFRGHFPGTTPACRRAGGWPPAG